ncbi:hypothetical protein ACFWA5_03225 [Streptomyces mirabilis]|uniref:hypothetical protein n=1 Tax=Streptomyces mirabilis TaxID=68239 RepID=UPI0036634FAA
MGGAAATETVRAELWASLAEVHTEEGHTSDEVTCPERLERISDRMGSGRKRLRYLLAILIAEGLTNRRTATVLRLGEDAVAGDDSGQLPTIDGHMAVRPH